jgi:hypothetical protein
VRLCACASVTQCAVAPSASSGDVSLRSVQHAGHTAHATTSTSTTLITEVSRCECSSAKTGPPFTRQVIDEVKQVRADVAALRTSNEARLAALEARQRDVIERLEQLLSELRRAK